MYLSKQQTARQQVSLLVLSSAHILPIKLRHLILSTKKLPFILNSFLTVMNPLALISAAISCATSAKSTTDSTDGLLFNAKVKFDDDDDDDELSINVVDVGYLWQYENCYVELDVRVYEIQFDGYLVEYIDCLIFRVRCLLDDVFFVGGCDQGQFFIRMKSFRLLAVSFYFDFFFIVLYQLPIILCYLYVSFYLFSSLPFLQVCNLISLDLDLILLLDLDFFLPSFLDKYCLLNDKVFCELDLFSCDFLVFSLLELTILPSTLIKALLSLKLIFFIIDDILLLLDLDCSIVYLVFYG